MWLAVVTVTAAAKEAFLIAHPELRQAVAPSAATQQQPPAPAAAAAAQLNPTNHTTRQVGTAQNMLQATGAHQLLQPAAAMMPFMPPAAARPTQPAAEPPSQASAATAAAINRMPGGTGNAVYVPAATAIVPAAATAQPLLPTTTNTQQSSMNTIAPSLTAPPSAAMLQPFIKVSPCPALPQPTATTATAFKNRSMAVAPAPPVIPGVTVCQSTYQLILAAATKPPAPPSPVTTQAPATSASKAVDATAIAIAAADDAAAALDRKPTSCAEHNENVTVSVGTKLADGATAAKRGVLAALDMNVVNAVGYVPVMMPDDCAGNAVDHPQTEKLKM